MMKNLSEDLQRLTLSFLNIVGRTRCLLVCRNWNRVGRSENERLAREEWRQLVDKYEESYPRRCQRRQEAVERGVVPLLDHALSELIVAVATRDENTALEDAHSEIRRLLDAGATASELLHYYDHDGPNLGQVNDNYWRTGADRFPGIEEHNSMLAILQELICSPCTSWRYHIHNRMYGGRAVPVELTRFAVRGDYVVWPCEDSLRAPFLIRWEALRTLRLMIYAAQHQEPETLERFCGDLFRDLSTAWGDLQSATTMFLMKECTHAILQHAPISVLQHVPISAQDHAAPYYYFYHSDCFSIRPILSILSVDELDCLDHLPLDDRIIRFFGATKEMQRFFCRLVRSSRKLRLVLLQYGMDAMCHRKDRKLLELLFRMETHAVVKTYLSRIIAKLENTRGKTERLLAFMRAVEATSQQRERVLDEFVTVVATRGTVARRSSVNGAKVGKS